MRPLHKVSLDWSTNLAYAIGLITTDGSLSKDGRHITFTSKDEQLALTFRCALRINNKIGRGARGGEVVKKYFVVQFGDVRFYEFLCSIGLMPSKSKSLGVLKIPSMYFWDFLRGCIDGDGNIHTFRHPESQYPQLRLRVYSASPPFLHWLLLTIRSLVCVRGYIEQGKRCSVLTFATVDSRSILARLYYSDTACKLERKYLLAKQFLRV